MVHATMQAIEGDLPEKHRQSPGMRLMGDQTPKPQLIRGVEAAAKGM